MNSPKAPRRDVTLTRSGLVSAIAVMNRGLKEQVRRMCTRCGRGTLKREEKGWRCNNPDCGHQMAKLPPVQQGDVEVLSPEARDAMIDQARAAFVAKIRRENFEGKSRQSLRAHWAGARQGFHDPMVQTRWLDFLSGWEAARATKPATVQRAPRKPKKTPCTCGSTTPNQTGGNHRSDCPQFYPDF